MKNKLTIIALIFFSLLLISCGYKKIIEKDQGTVTINEIKISGDKRVGYGLKNDILLSSSPGSQNLINIDLDINKVKEIKNKKISGKVEKYNIILKANVKIKNLGNDIMFTRIFSRSVDYEVMNNHSDTISNEKNAVEICASQLSDDIVKFINIYFKTK